MGKWWDGVRMLREGNGGFILRIRNYLFTECEWVVGWSEDLDRNTLWV
jgi:hypothetical protein